MYIDIHIYIYIYIYTYISVYMYLYICMYTILLLYHIIFFSSSAQCIDTIYRAQFAPAVSRPTQS